MGAKHFVVDASVVGAWFIKDEHSPVAERFRNAIAADHVKVSCPDFLLLELINLLLWKHVGPQDIADAVCTLTRIGIDFVPIAAIRPDLIIELAMTHRLTSYDALYYTLATQLAATLISADKALLKAAGSRGMHVNDFVE